MRKVALVFGGNGFIGSHLLGTLKASGEYDRLVSADISPAPRLLVSGVKYKYCDVRETIPDDLCPDATEIYNLAAVHTTPGHEDWEYFWTNVLGATNVCAYASAKNIRTIVFTSSISIYGPSEQKKDEDSRPAPTSAYGMSKLSAENIHRFWQQGKDDRRLVIVRPAVIFGYAEEGNFTRLEKLMRKRRFVFPGRRDTIKSCGYVKDLVSSFKHALSLDKEVFTYNFAYRERFTISDICEAFSRVAGYAPAKWCIPENVIMMGGLAFEILAKFGLKTSINRARVKKLVCSTNIFPKNLTATGFVYEYSLNKALADWLSSIKRAHQALSRSSFSCIEASESVSRHAREASAPGMMGEYDAIVLSPHEVKPTPVGSVAVTKSEQRRETV